MKCKHGMIPQWCAVCLRVKGTGAKESVKGGLYTFPVPERRYVRLVRNIDTYLEDTDLPVVDKGGDFI